MKQRKRNEAFLGAIIGAGANLIGGAISSIFSAKAEKRQAEKQEQLEKEQQAFNQATQDKQEALNNARSMTNAYADESYSNEYMKKVTLKNGGKMNDRIKQYKKFKAGGRKKYKWSASDTTDVIGDVGSGLSSIMSGVTDFISTNKQTDKMQNRFVDAATTVNQPLLTDTSIQQKSYTNSNGLINNTNNETNSNADFDRLEYNNMYKCGGRKKRK